MKTSTQTDLKFQHRFIPAADKAAAPTLLLLHGTGGDEDDLLPVGARLAEALEGGANLLSPRGKVLENGMPRFFRRFAEGIFDVQDVKVRAAELAEFAREAPRVYGFPVGRTVAVGYSNGANIGAATLLLEPGALAGAILFRALAPAEPDALPDLKGVRVLLVSGERDPIITPVQSRRLGSLLEQAGAEVSWHWYRGGHELTGEDPEAARSWLRANPF